jgi:hypothetical protein
MDIPSIEAKIAGGTLKLTGGLIWGVPKHANKNRPSSLATINAAFAKFRERMDKGHSVLVGSANHCKSSVDTDINGTVYKLAAELSMDGTVSMLDIVDELDTFLIALKHQLVKDLRDSLEPDCSTDRLEQVYALDPIEPKAESATLVSV